MSNQMYDPIHTMGKYRKLIEGSFAPKSPIPGDTTANPTQPTGEAATIAAITRTGPGKFRFTFVDKFARIASTNFIAQMVAARPYSIAIEGATTVGTTKLVDVEIWQLGDTNDTANAVASADASNLGTSETLANEIKAKLNAHYLQSGVHAQNDVTNTITSPDASGLPAVQTLANEIKAKYNLHRAQAGVHFTADAGNAISAADASDQTSANTLLNEIKADFNLHRVASLVHSGSWAPADLYAHAQNRVFFSFTMCDTTLTP